MARMDSEQRAKILDAAIRVFAEHGFDGASIRMVGDAAGFNSALLYYYFEDKQTLYLEAVRLVVVGLLDQLERQLRLCAGARPRIEFLVNGIFDYYAAHPDRMRLMGIVHTQHADTLARAIQDIFWVRVPVPMRVLTEGIRRGELRPLHPVHIWWSVLGACVFMLHMHRTLKCVDPKVLPVVLPSLDQARDELIALLCDGLILTSRSASTKPKHSRK
jgi:TetR/AcrR family transcriptional regulator